MNTNNENEQSHLVTIPHFVNVMLGIKSISWYYKHKADPGMPQQVYPSGPNGPARLVYEDCIRYIDQIRKGGRFVASVVLATGVLLSVCLYANHGETGAGHVHRGGLLHEMPFGCVISHWLSGRP